MTDLFTGGFIRLTRPRPHSLRWSKPPRLLLLAGLLLGLTWPLARAAEDETELAPPTALEDAGTEFALRCWTANNGLPHNSVGHILHDQRGFLWLGTVGGLARFDGQQFREFRPPIPHSPFGYNIRGLAVTARNVLLVIPTSGAVLCLEEGTWTEHPLSALLNARGESPQEIYVAPDQAVWVGTHVGSILRWREGAPLQVFNVPNAGIKNLRRWSFAADKGGRVWVATDGFLGCIQDDALSLRTLPGMGQISLADSASGEPWVCSDLGIHRLSQGSLQSSSPSAPWREEHWSLRDSFEDAQGVLWIAGDRQGVLRYQNRGFQRVAAALQTVNALGCDTEGKLWLGTDARGAAQLHPQAHRLYAAASGLQQPVVSSVSCDASGQILIANRQAGVARLGDDGLLHYEGQRLPFRLYANVLQAASGHTLWAGGGGNGLHRWQTDALERPQRLPKPSRSLHVLALARNGDLWFAGDPDVVGYYHGDELHLMGEEEGPCPPFVRCLTDDGEGRIWAGGNEGSLAFWDSHHWTEQRLFEPQQHWPIQALLAEPGTHRLWIGTTGGLFLREEDRLTHFGPAQGLADDLILGLAEDQQGRLWLSSRRGLYSVRKHDLLEVARGAEKQVVSCLLREGPDLDTLSFTANYQPNTARSPDGRLWFATSQGLLMLDPSRVPERGQAPAVFLDERRQDGRRRLELHLIPLAFGSFGPPQLRHRLEGMDTDWLASPPDGWLAYTNLQPGRYRLLAQARSGTSAWGAETVLLDFRLLPAWWETGVARVSGLLLLLGGTALLARLLTTRRMRRRLARLERENALERERLRIAQDLHDDLGAGLTELGLKAERLSKHTPAEAGPQAPSLATELAWHARRLSTDLSAIVWALSPRNNTVAHLGAFLERYAERLFKGLPLQVTITGGEALPSLPLSPEAQHHVISACKEGLNNLLKHAAAEQVEIRMRFDEEGLTILITDNGRGFKLDEAARQDGNGLRNMQARMEELGGTLELRSEPGQGTSVQLRLPLRALAGPGADSGALPRGSAGAGSASGQGTPRRLT